MAIRTLPDVVYLRECFSYDPDTGVLTWKARPRSHFSNDNIWRSFLGRFAGKIAARGSSDFNRKRRMVGINGEIYLVHRVIWKLQTGEEAPELVDHRNTNPSDNRWENLRLATVGQNNMNTNSRKGTITGIKGVYRNLKPGEKPFRAAISCNRKQFYLGCFDTIEDAAAAYRIAARELHKEFWNPG